VLSTSNCGSDSVCWFGFGPVVGDGLGLGYMIHDEAIPVYVTSFKNEAQPFAQHLQQSLLQMRAVLEKKGSASKP